MSFKEFMIVWCLALFLAFCLGYSSACAYDFSEEAKLTNEHFSIGDKFISKTGDIIELFQSIPIYANDDECLALMNKGYAIYCTPKPIFYRWKVIIYHYGIEIQGITDDKDLKELEKVITVPIN